ncbi:hypothetical protein AABB24_003660 [Solanum stoloniferum]|uniref:Uncharacterized protein n=1 Tax=Solanum stoloniferum TaxID=62892 RepID=A0ABD2V9D4_9SOLN
MRLTETEILTMDPTDAGAPLLSDQVQISGNVVPMTLTTGGKLRWPDRCLSIAKDVLGFTVEGSRIKINAVIESGPGICCPSNVGAPMRKTFTFEPLSEDSLRLWNQRLQSVIDSLGNYFVVFLRNAVLLYTQ